MKIRSVCSVSLIIILAACSGSKDTEKKSTEKNSVAAAPSGPAKRDPGNWQTDIKVVKIAAPGVPSGLESMLQEKMPSGVSTCLTKEAAEKEDLATEMAKGMQSDKCTFSKQELKGNNMDVAGKCNTPQGEMDVTMQGTVEPKKTDVTINITGKSPFGAGEMEMVLQVTTNNIGPCNS